MAIHIQCPRCGNFNELPPNTYWNYHGTYKCITCNVVMSLGLRSGELQQSPKIRDDVVYVEGAPEEVSSDFTEAQKCYNVEAYKASVVMCRRALECMADSMEATGRTLIKKIEDMNKQGLISARNLDIATRIRLFGNVGAHPDTDLLGVITASDAQIVLGITLHLLRDVYEVPVSIDELDKRLEKQ